MNISDEKQGNGAVKNLLTDAIFISLATAFIYLATYFYEFGYCAHFGIPTYLISLNTTTVLVAAGAIGSFVFSYLQLIGFLMPIWSRANKSGEKRSPYSYILLVNFLYFAVGAAFLKAYGFGLSGFLLFAFILAVINFFSFGVPLILSIGQGPIKERLREIEIIHDENPFDISKYIHEWIGRKGLLLFIFPFVTFGFCYLVGNGQAAKQVRFLTLSEHADYVVLRVYGDMVVAGRVDFEKKEVGPNYLIERINQELPEVFSAKYTGELKVSDVSPFSGKKQEKHEKN